MGCASSMHVHHCYDPSKRPVFLGFEVVEGRDFGDDIDIEEAFFCKVAVFNGLCETFQAADVHLFTTQATGFTPQKNPVFTGACFQVAFDATNATHLRIRCHRGHLCPVADELIVKKVLLDLKGVACERVPISLKYEMLGGTRIDDWLDLGGEGSIRIKMWMGGESHAGVKHAMAEAKRVLKESGEFSALEGHIAHMEKETSAACIYTASPPDAPSKTLVEKPAKTSTAPGSIGVTFENDVMAAPTRSTQSQVSGGDAALKASKEDEPKHPDESPPSLESTTTDAPEPSSEESSSGFVTFQAKEIEQNGPLVDGDEAAEASFKKGKKGKKKKKGAATSTPRKLHTTQDDNGPIEDKTTADIANNDLESIAGAQEQKKSNGDVQALEGDGVHNHDDKNRNVPKSFAHLEA